MISVLSRDKLVAEAGELERAGKREEARQHLRTVLDELPNDGEAGYFCGAICAELNDFEGAARSWSRVADQPGPFQERAKGRLESLLAQRFGGGADGGPGVVGWIQQTRKDTDFAARSQVVAVVVRTLDGEIINVELRGFDLLNAGNLRDGTLVRACGRFRHGVLRADRLELLNPWDLSTRSEVRASFSWAGRLQDQVMLKVAISTVFFAAVALVFIFAVLPAERESERDFERRTQQQERAFESEAKKAGEKLDREWREADEAFDRETQQQQDTFKRETQQQQEAFDRNVQQQQEAFDRENQPRREAFDRRTQEETQAFKRTCESVAGKSRCDQFYGP